MKAEKYNDQIGIFDDDTGNRLFHNTDSNGRFHSDWCSMLYSRLVLARNMLSADGCIFVSIDDNEITNLRNILDEVFGQSNFVAQIIWKKRSTPPNDQVIGAQHEYIVIYAKDILFVKLNLRERSDEQIEKYKNPDNHPKGPWVPGDLSANVKGGRYVASLYYPITNPNTGKKHYPPHDGNWRFNQEKMERLLANDEISFGENGLGRPKLKRFLCDVKQGITYTSLWDFVPLNTQGSKEMTELFGNLAVFDNPKPEGLIEELLRMGSDINSIILDFFSGSATTAHAAMKLNSEDGGNRKTIMIQLSEKCSDNGEAFKAGFKTICDIGKERIRRAGKKILEEHSSPLIPNSSLDIGFRVLKLDDSNMTDVYYSADKYDQLRLDDMESKNKPDRTDLDLLFGCLLEWGLPLSLPYKSETIDGCTVHTYAPGDPDLEIRDALIACFDEAVPTNVIETIARRNPLRAVFREECFTSSPGKINVFETFKRLAQGTAVKVI